MRRHTFRLQYNAPVTLSFFLLSLFVLLLDILTSGWSTAHLFCVYRSPLNDPLFYIRLFGHVLGHAGWDHFLNNMLLFLVIGPPMEEKYGSRTLLLGILSMLVCDMLARLFLLPINCITALLGIPIILWVIVKNLRLAK